MFNAGLFLTTFVFSSTILLFLDDVYADSPCNICPDQWTRYKGSCYLFADAVPVNFTNAVRFCAAQNYNSHLVALETSDENTFVKTFLQRLYHKESDYWLGASDELVEGHFVWKHSGTPLAFTDWAQGQPNDYHGHEDCATFDTRHHFQWQDSYDKHKPLCELEFAEGTTISVEIIG